MRLYQILIIAAVMLLMLFAGFTLYDSNIKKHRTEAFLCGVEHGSGYIIGMETRDIGAPYNESMMRSETRAMGYKAGYYNLAFTPPPCMLGGKP